MSPSLSRLIVVVVLVAVAAIAVPQVAPTLIAAYDAATGAPSDADATATNTGPEASPAQTMLAHSLSIGADTRGHYVTKAIVNGSSIDVMVDTGATIVALTPDTARRLGIHLGSADFTAHVSTANGDVAGAPVTLSEVRVGDIVVRDVAGVVIRDSGMELNLLGMSFLNRLTRFEAGGGHLLLVQ